MRAERVAADRARGDAVRRIDVEEAGAAVRPAIRPGRLHGTPTHAAHGTGATRQGRCGCTGKHGWFFDSLLRARRRVGRPARLTSGARHGRNEAGAAVIRCWCTGARFRVARPWSSLRIDNEKHEPRTGVLSNAAGGEGRRSALNASRSIRRPARSAGSPSVPHDPSSRRLARWAFSSTIPDGLVVGLNAERSRPSG